MLRSIGLSSVLRTEARMAEREDEPTGIGCTAPPSPAFFLCGLVGFLAGAVGLTVWRAAYERSEVTGMLILMPSIVAFSLGGLFFNVRTWGFVGKALVSDAAGTVMAACSFFACLLVALVVLMFAAAEQSPASLYWEFEGIKRDVSLCSTEEWKDYKGGIYFQDGALTEHGHTTQALHISISPCYVRVEGSDVTVDEIYYNCYFAVRPIFQCDSSSALDVSDACISPRACAWAITSGEGEDGTRAPPLEPPKAPDCGTSGARLCGEVFRLKKFMREMAAQPKSIEAFYRALQTAGRQLPGNLTEESPLLFLTNPEEQLANVRPLAGFYYFLLLIYVPFSAVVGLLVLARRGCGNSARPFARLEEDDESGVTSMSDG